MIVAEDVKPNGLHRICEVCQTKMAKYKCPKCLCRSCSMECSKAHKIEQNCSGERQQQFLPTRTVSDISPLVYSHDKQFLKVVREEVGKILNSVENQSEKEITLVSNENPEADTSSKTDEDASKEFATSSSANIFSSIGNKADCISLDLGTNIQEMTMPQHYLLRNSNRRRVWLRLSDEGESNSSRHEKFSDTIFWMITLIFRRELEIEGRKSVSDYTYTVHNIPESISLTTLIRQFIKPKEIGTVVSKCDLDLKKLSPFQEAGLDNLIAYMPVPIENKTRFYVVGLSNTILDNLRNRFIKNHPVFIITLNNQFFDYVTISDEESQLLREQWRKGVKNENNHFSNHQKEFHHKYRNAQSYGGYKGNRFTAYQRGRSNWGPRTNWRHGYTENHGKLRSRSPPITNAYRGKRGGPRYFDHDRRRSPNNAPTHKMQRGSFIEPLQDDTLNNWIHAVDSHAATDLN